MKQDPPAPSPYEVETNAEPRDVSKSGEQYKDSYNPEKTVITSI